MRTRTIEASVLALLTAAGGCGSAPSRPDSGSIEDDAASATVDGGAPAPDAYLEPGADAGRPPRDGGPLPPRDGAPGPARDVGPRDGGPSATVDARRSPDDGGGGGVDPTVRVSVVIHLEGRTLGEPAVRDRYATFLRSYADAFERHGARITIETAAFSDSLYAEGSGPDHILAELEARGHDIGVHADVGGVLTAGYDQTDFVADLVGMRDRQIAIGLHPSHVSGICSSLDWVTAAIDAGFPFATSTVDYCLKSLPIELQPPEVAACTSPSSCHHAYPHDMPESLEVRRVRSGADWITPAADGRLVLVPSSGSLACFAESAADPDFGGSMCTLDAADTAAHVADLDAAIAAAVPDRINSHEVVWSLGQPMADALLEEWLTDIDERVARGEAQWATAAEVVAAYAASE